MTRDSTPPFLDLRSFLAHLDRSGRLRHVAKAVDKDWELACIARWALESTPERDTYAILFEHVRNHSAPVVVNLYSTPEMYASALGISPDCLLKHWANALESPCVPSVVGSGPVQEVVRTGSKVDLLSIPAPIWTPGQDAGPYLSAANVITKDPDTGIQNMGIYRMQIHDRNHAGLCFASKMQHGAMHLKKYGERRQPMPIAAVIGAAPVVTFASAAKLPYGVDELGIAGGLAASSLEVVRGKTVDLLVPAQAELVIEGFVHPESRETEGPFGEFLGYVNGAAPAPVVEVTAITHRSSPIHHGFVQQLPPSDGHFVMEMGFLGPLWFNVNRKLGLKGIRDLAIARGSAGLGILVVQIEKAHASESAHIGRMLAKFSSGLSFIYLVDEDIDIRDQESLNWALSSRVGQPKDIEFVRNLSTSQSDYSKVSDAETKEPACQRNASAVVVNAIAKSPMSKISLPTCPLMLKTLETWHETGLPPLSPRKRLITLLKSHSKD